MPASGPSPGNLAHGPSTNTLRRIGSKQAITLLDMRGGKKGAKELAGRLQRLHQADVASSGGLDPDAPDRLQASAHGLSSPTLSPVLSPNSHRPPFFGEAGPSSGAAPQRRSAESSAPPAQGAAASGAASPPPQKFAALESMLQTKLETAEDGKLADYHILTHKKDARSQKKAAIGGRHIGSRFSHNAGADFDAGLLNDFLSLRNQRVQQTTHATLDRPLLAAPAPLRRSPGSSLGFSPAHAPTSALRLGSPATSPQGPGSVPGSVPGAPFARVGSRGSGLRLASQQNQQDARQQSNRLSRSSVELGRFSSGYMAPSAGNVMGMAEVEAEAQQVEEEGDDSDDDDGESYKSSGYGSSAHTLGRNGSATDASFRQSISETLDEHDLYPNRESIIAEAPNSDGSPVMARKYTRTKVDGPPAPSTVTRQPSAALLLRVGSLNRFAPPPPAGPAPPEASSSLATRWREVFDTKGRRYFYHEESMETTWTQPAHFLRHDEGFNEDGYAEGQPNDGQAEAVGRIDRIGSARSLGSGVLERHGSARSIERRVSAGRSAGGSVLAARGSTLPGSLGSSGDLLAVLSASGQRRSFSPSQTASAADSADYGSRRGSASLTTDLDASARDSALGAPNDLDDDGDGGGEELRDSRASQSNGAARRMSEFIVENADQFHFEPLNEATDGVGVDMDGMAGGMVGDADEGMPAIASLRRGSHTAEGAGGAVRRVSGLEPTGTGGAGDAGGAGGGAPGSLYWWDLNPSEGGTWDPRTRLWRAGVYCRDAINERPIKLHRASRTPLAVYAFVQSDWWNRLYVTTSLLHLGLLFLEPASWG